MANYLRFSNFGRSKSIEAPSHVLAKYHRKPISLNLLELTQWIGGIGIVVMGLSFDSLMIASTTVAAGLLFITASILCGIESHWFRLAGLIAYCIVSILCLLNGLLVLAAPIALIGFFLAFYPPITQYYQWCKKANLADES